MAGNLTVEVCGNVFASSARRASTNYGIGSDGRVGLYVEESQRSWASSNIDNDNQAITIEVANNQIGGEWRVSDVALAKLIDLCEDICRRNKISALNFTGNRKGNVTLHRFFTATLCPGPYLTEKIPHIVDEVNRRLRGVPLAPDVLFQVHTQAFGRRVDAEVLERKLKTQGFSTVVVRLGSSFRIQLGVFRDKANADALISRLQAAGFEAFITVNQRRTSQ